MDSQKRASQDSGNRRPVSLDLSTSTPVQSYTQRFANNYITRQSDAARFSKITDMKRSPTNDNAAARRASWEEQTIPRGAGVLGDMWNR